jgi:hypothetical protein
MSSFRLAIWSALIVASQVQAQLRVPAPVADLGAMKSGQPLSHSFELINDGPEAVEILETRGSCGCLLGQVEPRIIQPGKSGSLVLRAHTLGQSAGPHSWGATLRYRQGSAENEITVGIKVCLVTEVSVEPATLTLITDNILTQIVTLTDRRAEPLKVVGVQTSSPDLEACLLDQDHGSGHIRLETQKGLAPGRHDELLTIDTDDPLYRQLQVPVTIIKTSVHVVAIPARVEMVAKAGEPASCLIRLRSESEQAVTISKVEVAHPALSCRWAPGPGKQATVRIQLDPGQWAGRILDTELTIHIAGPQMDNLKIPIFIHGTEQGRP